MRETARPIPQRERLRDMSAPAIVESAMPDSPISPSLNIQQAKQPRSETNSTDRNDAAEMVRYGITEKAVPQYHYREYRYSSLRDAVAQARRDIGQNLADL